MVVLKENGKNECIKIMGWSKQADTNIELTLEDANAHETYSTADKYRFTILKNDSAYITADTNNKLDDSTELTYQTEDKDWLTDVSLNNDKNIDTDIPSYFLTFGIKENKTGQPRLCNILIGTNQNNSFSDQLTLTIKQPGKIQLKDIYLAAVKSETDITSKALKEYLLGIKIGDSNITPLYNSDDTNILIYNSTDSTNQIDVQIQPISTIRGYFQLKSNEDNTVIYNQTKTGGSENISFNNNVISYNNWDNTDNKTFTLNNYPAINIKLVNSLIIYNFTLYVGNIGIEDKEIYNKINDNSTISFGNNGGTALHFKGLEVTEGPATHQQLGKEKCNGTTTASNFSFTIAENDEVDWSSITIPDPEVEWTIPICTIYLEELYINDSSTNIGYTIHNNEGILYKQQMTNVPIWFYILQGSNNFYLYCSNKEPSKDQITYLYIQINQQYAAIFQSTLNNRYDLTI